MVSLGITGGIEAAKATLQGYSQRWVCLATFRYGNKKLYEDNETLQHSLLSSW
jgi:hypothetical protein